MTEAHALKMDEPVEHSLLDRKESSGIVGKPVDRVDGPKKVSGEATYAAEYALENVAHGYLVQAPFGCGTITLIDVKDALGMPGVIDVIMELEKFIRNPAQGLAEEAPVQGVREVAYFREAVALVVAESFEQARAAAQAVRIEHTAVPGRFDFDKHASETETPPDAMIPADKTSGDIDAAMKSAAFTVDVTYTTPSQNSAAMEPHASIAVWDDDAGLTLYSSLQMLASNRKQLADALDLPPEKVRLLSAFVGGGFGSKLGISPDTVAAALAARRLGRPIKTVMTRQQVFDATVRRSNTRQRMRLGADADGHLLAIGHESISTNLPEEDFFEPSGIATHFLYAGEARRVTHRIVRLNQLLSGSMRAPGEASGMLAFECAIDEIADRLGMDPVVFRILNEPAAEPGSGRPYSSRNLVRCLEEGASRFRWNERNGVPGGRAEGEWLRAGRGGGRPYQQARDIGSARHAQVGRHRRDRDRYDGYWHRHVYRSCAGGRTDARAFGRTDRRSARGHAVSAWSRVGRVGRREFERLVGISCLRGVARQDRARHGMQAGGARTGRWACGRSRSPRVACNDCGRRHVSRGQDRFRQARRKHDASELRCALLRGPRQQGDWRDAGQALAEHVRGWPHFERKDRALAVPWRHHIRDRCSTDRGTDPRYTHGQGREPRSR
jgi:hypothetical protein